MADPTVKEEPVEEETTPNRERNGEDELPLSTTCPRKRKRKLTLKKRENAFSSVKKCVSETMMKNVTSDASGKYKSSKKNNASADGKRAEPKSPAMIRAEEVQSNLEASFPSFAKSMVRSHVSSCFWMGLPGPFCKLHLPNKDTIVILENESGNHYEIKYIADKTGLSAGWRQFVNGHNLVEGDVLVFQLVEPTKFKVYIIRANDFTEVDGALGLLTLDAHAKSNDGVDDNAELSTPPSDVAKRKELGTSQNNNAKRKRSKSLALSIVQKKNRRSGKPQSAPNAGIRAEQSENDSEEVGSEVLESSKLPVPTIQFKDIKSLENFNMAVDGWIIDSEISEDTKSKYYGLCCSQNVFLHENLTNGINSKLIIGTISETVSIADAIRACNLATPREELAAWDKTLKAFELLGMNVGFLRARLHKIISLAYESERGNETRRYIEAKAARERAEDEIRSLEEKLVKLRGDCQRLGAEVDSLKPIAESYEVTFQEEVSAPW